MDRAELVAFVRAQGLAVVATRGPAGAPQATLVGVSATDRAEIVFDTSDRCRKYANIQNHPEVAVVIGGWHDEVTVQCEGPADILSGPELELLRVHPGPAGATSRVDRVGESRGQRLALELGEAIVQGVDRLSE